MTRPTFGVVCNHGDADAPADRVARLQWDPERPGWWPVEGLDLATALVYPLDADERGHDPKWLRPEWTEADEPDERRWAVEIRCATAGCTTWSYRCDEGALQTLLEAIATDDRLRAAVAVSADDALIVMRLQALHLARDYARRHLGLRV